MYTKHYICNKILPSMLVMSLKVDLLVATYCLAVMSTTQVVINRPALFKRPWAQYTKMWLFSNVAYQMSFQFPVCCQGLCTKDAMKSTLTCVGMYSPVMLFKTSVIIKHLVTFWAFEILKISMQTIVFAQIPRRAKSFPTFWTFVMFLIEVGSKMNVSTYFDSKRLSTNSTRVWSHVGVNSFHVGI